MCQTLFFNKVAGLRAAPLLKRGSNTVFFPVNFAKSLRISFLQITSGRLFLYLNGQGLLLECERN